MKTYQKITTALLIVLLVVPVTFLSATPKVEAACSYQGYISSGGNCAKSYTNTAGYIDIFNYNGDNNENDYSNNCFSGNCYSSQIDHLKAIIVHLQAIIDSLKNAGGYDDSNIEVTTVYATNVNDDSAKLRGEVDLNDSDTAEVWFQYGENRNNLDEKTSKQELDDRDSKSFSKTINNLDDNSTYYFRAIGRDEDGDIDYGSIMSFRTSYDYGYTDIFDGSSPNANTDRADNVTDDSAVLQGSIDMNDFENGKVFFVYGEDGGLVGDVEHDFDTYSDVDEAGDDLQKVLVDSGLDNKDDYEYSINNLDDNTDYFFSICVEYENENNDDDIICGDVEDFETDSN